MKNFNPEREAFSFVFIEEYMFILAESTGILLDPRCRIAFQNDLWCELEVNYQH